MAYIIETESLTKKFGDLAAVNTVTLNVRKGSLFGLLGPNGSGKTTMIKMLTGQILPSSGNAHVLGLDVATDPVGIRTLVGIIPEQESPPSFLTAMEYLEFIGDIRKIPDLEQKADWWFDFLEYGDKRNVLCKDLSRGTRQKLMLTQAFIHNPALALI
jgi:ABC-2 type transport system ATP-binding protein